MASCSTRSRSRHSVFGFSKELTKNVLPTCEDIFRAYCFYRQKEEHLTSNDIVTTVASEVTEIYNTASIPTIAFDSIMKKVKRLIEKGNDLRKYPDSKRTSVTYQEALSNFSSLFDICSRKCVDAGVVDRKDCKCPVECKIPAIEWNFWVDQKTTRKMVIGKIDPVATGKLQNLEERKRKAAKLQAETRRKMGDCNVISEELEMPCSSEMEDTDDSSIEVTDDDSSESDSCSTSGPQNRNQYPELCKAIDRANVSNRDACLIANAVLKDLGLLSPENALHPSKLRHQRAVWRKKTVEIHKEENEGIACLGFDGKIDVTLARAGSTCRKIKEEHYVLVSFPSQSYVEHVVPGSGKANDISREILSVIRGSRSETTLRALVCDGTAVNTGKYNGVIRKIELHLGRPLQWLICLMHANELPLRKLIEVVDGKTTGPKTSG